MTRHVIWQFSGRNFKCHGRYVRTVCIFGLQDLPSLSRSPSLFANKFYYSENPAVLECLDELIMNRTRDEYYGTLKFNTSFYENLEFVKYALRN